MTETFNRLETRTGSEIQRDTSAPSILFRKDIQNLDSVATLPTERSKTLPLSPLVPLSFFNNMSYLAALVAQELW